MLTIISLISFLSYFLCPAVQFRRFYDIDVFRIEAKRFLRNIGLNKLTRNRAFLVMKFCARSLTQLGNEMFRITHRTRGGLMLMLIFFYFAYVYGTVLWVSF